MQTKSLGPFLGINNRLPDTALHVPRTGDFLSAAENVDIDDAGRIHRRAGTALLQAMANAHSLHMTSETTGFMVRASVLYAVTLPAYTETLLKVLASDARMSYAVLGDSWYFSNGTDRGRVTAGVTYPMGLPTPASPAVALIGGELLKGDYQVSVSYSNSVTGEEGGAAASTNYTLASTGGLRVTLPAATSGATHINVYLSAANGEVPTLAAAVALGTASYDLIALATGRETTGRYEAPLPAGTLFNHNGRLCSFSGSLLYVGLPFRPGYYLPAEGYIPFPSAINVAAPNQGGVYVAADKTYFIPGDLGNVESTILDVLPYGAVPGTVFTHPAKTIVGWFGARGFVLADTQGGAEAVMTENVNVVPPTSGVATVSDCDGYFRAMSCGWCINLTSNAATSYAGWDFTSTSGSYGTKADGIYSLHTAGPVDATVGFGKQNFGTEVLKHLPAVYLGVNAPSAMRLRVQAPNAVDYTYSARSISADTQMQRVDPGKGLRATWFDLTLMNTDGADFTLATVSFAPTTTTRRI